MANTGRGEGRRAPTLEALQATPLEVREYLWWIEAELGRTQSEARTADLLSAEQRRRLERALADRDRQIRRLKDELALANERAALSSRNSSKPPSSDPPHAHTPKPKQRSRAGARRGGQPGHPKYSRPLVAPDLVTSTHDHVPERCARCSAELSGSDPDPLRHQIIELPPVRPLVEEHRLHSLTCACGHTTRACLPAGVSGTGFGPRVEATVALLVGGCRLSHRTTAEVMGELFGVRLGLGTVTNLLARAGASLEHAVEQARAFVRWYEGTKYVDETPWYQRGADGSNEDGRQAYLWTVATAPVTAFTIALTRSAAHAKQILGEAIVGSLMTDRYKGYQYVNIEQRQICWAHLARDFERMRERRGEAGRVGRDLARLAKRVFRLWRRMAEGEIEREVWHSAVEAARFRMKGILERVSGWEIGRHERSQRSKTRNTCRELLGIEEALWHFIEHPEVGMTNNFAERQLRHAVLLRKVSFGSQSAAGAETMARLLTVIQTQRSRGESAHEFLVASCEAAHAGRAGPPLVPGAETTRHAAA